MAGDLETRTLTATCDDGTVYSRPARGRGPWSWSCAVMGARGRGAHCGRGRGAATTTRTTTRTTTTTIVPPVECCRGSGSIETCTCFDNDRMVVEKPWHCVGLGAIVLSCECPGELERPG